MGPGEIRQHSMVAFDAAERLTPFRDAAGGYGAILFDAKRLRQARAEWFSPAAWDGDARPEGPRARGCAGFNDDVGDPPLGRGLTTVPPPQR